MSPETPTIDDATLLARFPGHPIDRDSAAHYRGRLARQLLFDRCNDCGAWYRTPRPVCAACWCSNLKPTAVAGNGIIYLAVFLHQGPPAQGVDYRTPYPVVTVELDEEPGLRFTSTVVGSPNESIRIGRRVRLDWIDRLETPVPVFRLVEDDTTGRADP